jgi:hypothetical protein
MATDTVLTRQELKRRARKDINPEFREPPVPWSRQATAWIRTLPDFLIIGAQRAGTTSLYRYLVSHQDVSPALRKEIHYFDRFYPRGQAWYQAHFPPFWARRQRLGEASPSYLFFPKVPERVQGLLPHAKLIVLLRNPIDRAYSHYQMKHRKGWETHSFAAAVAQEEDRIREHRARLWQDPDFYAYNYRHFSYTTRGLYAEQLERWFAHFDRRQMLILKSEALLKQRETTLPQIWEFLGLKRVELPAEETRHATAYEPLDPGLRRDLMRFYDPHNARLSTLLQSEWRWW